MLSNGGMNLRKLPTTVSAICVSQGDWEGENEDLGEVERGGGRSVQGGREECTRREEGGGVCEEGGVCKREECVKRGVEGGVCEVGGVEGG